MLHIGVQHVSVMATTTCGVSPEQCCLMARTWIASIPPSVQDKLTAGLCAAPARANRSQALPSALPQIPYFHPRPSAACKFAVPKWPVHILLARGCCSEETDPSSQGCPSSSRALRAQSHRPREQVRSAEPHEQSVRRRATRAASEGEQFHQNRRRTGRRRLH